MKTIGVIGAMPEEITLLKSRMTDVESEKAAMPRAKVMLKKAAAVAIINCPRI